MLGTGKDPLIRCLDACLGSSGMERHLKSCVFAPASFCQNEGMVENSGANAGKAMYKDRGLLGWNALEIRRGMRLSRV